MKSQPQKLGRRSRGGGGVRRAQRTGHLTEFSRFIERNIPHFEILTTEAIEIIEYNAETVLEEIGVKFVDNPIALAKWKEAGASIYGETVKIPRGLARLLCKTLKDRLRLGVATSYWHPFMGHLLSEICREDDGTLLLQILKNL